jgi:sortase A
LSGLAVLALGFCGWELGISYLHHVLGERRLASMAAGPASALAPSVPVATRAEVARSGLVGRLEIPRLGLAAIVEEGVDQRTLRHAAGHLPGTALPGEAGNVVVAGHRDTFFRPLRDVRAGDTLRFVTPDGVFQYTVAALDVVPPTATDVVAQGSRAEATLITCYPFGYVGPAPQRFVVRAALAAPARVVGRQTSPEDVERSE